MFFRGQATIPMDAIDEVEVLDPLSYRFPLERFAKNFVTNKNCGIYLYLICPRTNSKSIQKKVKNDVYDVTPDP